MAYNSVNSNVADNIEQLANSTSKLDELASNSEQLFKKLETSSDKAVKGILTGTETWRQAMLNVIGELEIKFAQMAVNNLLNLVKSQAQSLVSTNATNEQMVASNAAKNASIGVSDTTASDIGAASHAAQLIKQIKSDAAATYAGVFAFMSPIMGPAAAIPAGISAAAVGAMEGLISLDVGAWNLGSDTVAQLHKGEMVVPKTFAEGLRGNGGIGGGAGDNYTININAIDTQSGAQFIKNNASGIAAAISSQVRNFNGNVPAWKG